MKLPGSQNQQIRHFLYCADGTITTGGAAQLILGQSQSRSYLLVENLSTTSLWIEIGSARAHATLTSGVVTSVTVDNAGFNFTNPPVIEFYGGGNAGNSSYLGLNQPTGAAPNSSLNAGRPAKAHTTLSGGAVNAVVVDDGGAGYVIAPYVLIYNSDLDPYGCAVPATNSGILLQAGGSFTMEGTVCTTDSISIFGANTGQQFACRWMD